MGQRFGNECADAGDGAAEALRRCEVFVAPFLRRCGGGKRVGAGKILLVAAVGIRIAPSSAVAVAKERGRGAAAAVGTAGSIVLRAAAARGGTVWRRRDAKAGGHKLPSAPRLLKLLNH